MGFILEMTNPVRPNFRCEKCGVLAHCTESVRHDAGGPANPNRNIFILECESCGAKADKTITRADEHSPWIEEDDAPK